MPIRPELRHFYTGPIWWATRLRILARAGNCCEQCGKPNGKAVLTVSGGYSFMAWTLCEASAGSSVPWRDCYGHTITRLSTSFQPRIIRVVLTIAHLNHVSGDDRDENLKALCQWCHLNYDKLHHQETRAERKDRGRPLLVVARKGATQ